jgi:hypothetical protein
VIRHDSPIRIHGQTKGLINDMTPISHDLEDEPSGFRV